MAVGDLQLRLHDAAQAAAVRPVQPLPHHPQPIVAFLAIEGEVLHFGSDAPASPGSRASASRCRSEPDTLPPAKRGETHHTCQKGPDEKSPMCNPMATAPELGKARGCLGSGLGTFGFIFLGTCWKCPVPQGRDGWGHHPDRGRGPGQPRGQHLPKAGTHGVGCSTSGDTLASSPTGCMRKYVADRGGDSKTSSGMEYVSSCMSI